MGVGVSFHQTDQTVDGSLPAYIRVPRPGTAVTHEHVKPEHPAQKPGGHHPITTSLIWITGDKSV
jgi:hypothetical protein